MARTVRSFLSGQWVEGRGEGTPLVNPTTEAELARATTDGLDLGAALDFARQRGGPALRELTFAQRGERLAAMAKVIHTHRDALIEIAVENGGNTRGDAKFDIDGASFTLSHYAKLGQQLGDRHLLADGELLPLARNPRFAGGHLFAPRQGVAVHINAFNFPAWGFGEKAAMALLAGMPVLTKPAPATALLAEQLIEHLLEAGVLPAGALSLLSGPPGDLLGHLAAQDVLAFTGSAATGALVRSHPGLVRAAVPITVEADSLNAAVVGPDVEPGSDAWQLFVRDTAREITQKAGQKCTATRRILVSQEHLASAREELAAALAEVAVGDPGLREVKMGPLVSAEQLARVRAGLGRLQDVTRPLLGDGGRGRVLGVEGERGYFMAPVLVEAKDPTAAVIHGEEVFGPVATLLAYQTPAEAAQLVQRAGGGLVVSLYSDDRARTEAWVRELAPYHGRIYIGSSKVAELATGAGTVLPALVHGGPGRAGGGEELGGLRGMAFYLQRTALQGDRPLLERILGLGS